MSKKILIADKSITIRSIAESLLRQMGYEVFTASEQDKALSSIKESHPDLIFLDYSLPSVSLSIFLQTLKSEGELKNVPLVLLLPISELKKQESLIQKENLSYLVKPFTPKELLVKTEEFIKESKTPAPPLSSSKKKSGTDLPEETSAKEVDAFFDSLNPAEETQGKTEKSSLAEEEEDLVLSTSFADTPVGEESQDPDRPHDYEWFLDEMKKEDKKSPEKKKTAKATPPKNSAKPKEKDEELGTKKLDVQVQEMGTSKLKLDKILAKMKEEKEEEDEDEPVSGYAQLKNDKETAKEELVKTKKLPVDAIIPSSKKEPPPKSAPPKETPPLDYQKMVEEIVEEVSDKLAKEIVKKIDKDSVSKLLKEKIENLDFKIS